MWAPGAQCALLFLLTIQLRRGWQGPQPLPSTASVPSGVPVMSPMMSPLWSQAALVRREQ